MFIMNNFKSLKNEALLERFGQLVGKLNAMTATLIAHLAEIDRRKLYAKEGYSSLFTFCVEKYHFSEGGAYKRISAARLSQKFPEVLGLLKDGKLNLSIMSMIAPIMTIDNKKIILDSVQNKTKREAEKVIATLMPDEREVKDKIRKLPVNIAHQKLSTTVPGDSTLPKESAGEQMLGQMEPGTPLKGSQGSFCPTANHRDKVKPITERHVKVEFRASERFAKNLERAKQLLSHKYPKGGLEEIFGELLHQFLEKKAPELKFNKKKQPLSFRGRVKRARRIHYIPAPIRREIFKRDNGKCTYKSPSGKVCEERAFLEVDHIRPVALGGKSTIENLRLLCRTHNQWRVKQSFSLSFRGAP